MPKSYDLQNYVQVPANKIVGDISCLSQSVKMVAKWAETNRLSLKNTKKTQAIVFGSSHIIKQFKNFSTILDSTLSWKPPGFK